MKFVYVNIGKPITFNKFELYESPMGWYRLSILKRNLKYKNFKSNFTKEELKLIKDRSEVEQ